ncbi:MAG: branched-chain amino acid ABC transporter permease [Dehalococcoidia bacterium]|jgi:branched-chain amino acid transport system permease protein|nr:branched-chain amino acid ABC transporter permease [Dehalococcoidia bacterium]MDP6226732.1 branched-chain amino acid ABC transporter permease [Dehalococcoidia bacterium]MDP7082964.1 branched-chain amino acid ABC transporter permease [Dehalococcoidia bacterium]MDP7201191.1 branched-chain amino acid ABC transporter permease [Dehalococcoidia bacterium]MDP7510344.1 branched-chain amino acid ABC transporter permease [Dehalococcoidia bacterium]
MDFAGTASYLSGFAILAGIYAVFALGLNVHWGYTGLFNIGIAGFFALGAYTTALLTTASPDPALFEDFKFGGNLVENLGPANLGVDLWFLVALLAAGAVCGLVALAIGFITLRLRDDYLAIATLGIAEGVRLVFLNEKWLANGSKGLYRIPKFLGDVISPKNYDYLYLVVVLVVLAILYVSVERVLRSPWGRALKAIREDEMSAAASGKNVFAFKLQSFVMGAVIMGFGGALYAHNIRFVDPRTFDPLLATFVIWAMLMVGGSGNNLGAILGAFVVWGIWTGTQFLPGFLSDPNFRFFMVGFLVVAAILLRPEGILGERRVTSRPVPADAEAAAAEP